MTLPSNPQSSPAATFAGVAGGSQLGVIVLWVLQTFGGHPIPETVGDAIIGFTAAAFAYLIHKFNEAN